MACTTSEHEPFPVFATAALAAGKPVVAADVDDLGALLADGPCGIAVRKVGDLEAFAAGVASLADDERRRRLGRRGPQVAARRCGLEPHLAPFHRALATDSDR